jgi:sulfur-oxidizing protein SoxY
MRRSQVIDLKRRAFLRATAASGAMAIAAGAGLLRPTRVLAAESWPASAFHAKKRDAALKALFGSSSTSVSDKVVVTANAQAEDGRSVPVAVTSSLPNVEDMSILVLENVQPLAARCRISPNGAAYFRANIKMAKTSDVEFVIRAGGKLYSAKKKIKVTAGGCGG